VIEHISTRSVESTLWTGITNSPTMARREPSYATASSPNRPSNTLVSNRFLGVRDHQLRSVGMGHVETGAN
jgi:hypothetical protein